MMKLEIQKFGGRGASSGTTGTYLGQQTGGFLSGGQRYFAGDKVTRNGKEYMVTDVRGNKLEIYNGDETLKLSSASDIKLESRGSAGQSILAKERVTVLRAADERTTINGRSVAMYNKVPKGFSKTSGATTAPKGYEWYSNNKSLFGDERINILVKKKK